MIFMALRARVSAVFYSAAKVNPFYPCTRKEYLDYCFLWLNQFFDKGIQSFKEIPVRLLEEQEVLKKKALDKIDEDYKNNPKNRDLIKKNFLDNYKTDQQLRDETINKSIGNKNDVIKRYEAELEKTRAANLLNAPAEIYSPFTVSEGTPIFANGPEGGKMLVTANPTYIRKECRSTYRSLWWCIGNGSATSLCMAANRVNITGE